MSLQNSTRKHNRELLTLKEKGNLIIPRNIIEKIEFLHRKIGGVEWSSILIYETISGTIEDPSSLVLKVKDIILMDIGNATYTEYKFDSDDEYSFDKYTSALENGYKLGHIHTHHSMNCFFSGTDTDELHDNAPNHNFYLSLIVNFKSLNDWCAAIAVCAEEETTGEVLTKRTWKGANGIEVRNNTVPINNKREILYKIDLNIEPENPANFDELDERIASIKAKKVSNIVVTHNSNNYFNEGYTSRHFSWDDNKNPKANNLQNKLNSPERFGKDKKKNNFKQEQREIEFSTYGKSIKSRNCYSPGKVRPALIHLLLGNDSKVEFVDQALRDLTTNKLFEEQAEFILEHFDYEMDKFFKMDGDDLDYHCLATSFLDILKPFRAIKNLEETAKIVSDAIDMWVDEDISSGTTEFYTGIKEETTDFDYYFD